MSKWISRAPRRAFVLLALAGALVVPAVAAGARATETFHRQEVVATANFLVNKACPDGRTVTQRVTVIGGHERESQSGESTLDDEFVTVLIRGFDCDGNFVNDRATGPAEFTYSPSLQTASVTGTVIGRTGSVIEVDTSWDGVGLMETSSNTTTFQGFTSHFTSKRRDAVATGTVVVDGETLVDGSTTNAEIESLEDRNISTGAGG